MVDPTGLSFAQPKGGMGKHGFAEGRPADKTSMIGLDQPAGPLDPAAEQRREAAAEEEETEEAEAAEAEAEAEAEEAEAEAEEAEAEEAESARLLPLQAAASARLAEVTARPAGQREELNEMAEGQEEEPGGIPKEAAWEAQLARLAAYKAAHGDCSVPRGRDCSVPLGNWAKTQRQYKRKLDRGEPSKGMTAERVARLEALGFAWAPPARPRKAARRAGGLSGAEEAAAGPADAPTARPAGQREELNEMAEGQEEEEEEEEGEQEQEEEEEEQQQQGEAAAAEEQEQEEEGNGVDEGACVREISAGAHVSALAAVFGRAWAIEARRAIRS
jgi:hypothetical protein